MFGVTSAERAFAVPNSLQRRPRHLLSSHVRRVHRRRPLSTLVYKLTAILAHIVGGGEGSVALPVVLYPVVMPSKATMAAKASVGLPVLLPMPARRSNCSKSRIRRTTFGHGSSTKQRSGGSLVVKKPSGLVVGSSEVTEYTPVRPPVQCSQRLVRSQAPGFVAGWSVNGVGRRISHATSASLQAAAWRLGHVCWNSLLSSNRGDMLPARRDEARRKAGEAARNMVKAARD